MPNAKEHIKSDSDPDERKCEPVGNNPPPQVRVVGNADRCESDNSWEELEIKRTTTLSDFCSINAQKTFHYPPRTNLTSSRSIPFSFNTWRNSSGDNPDPIKVKVNTKSSTAIEIATSLGNIGFLKPPVLTHCLSQYASTVKTLGARPGRSRSLDLSLARPSAACESRLHNS